MARTAPTVSTSRALRTARPVRLAVVGAALSMAFALTSCSDSGGNNGDDAASPTASSATASNTEFIPASADGPAQNVPVPELPDAAREQTPEGAEATLEYWWDALDYLYLTNDPAPLLKISGTDCVMCKHFQEVVPEALSEDRWYVIDGAHEVEDVSSDLFADQETAEFEYTVLQPRAQLLEGSGTQIAEHSSSAQTVRVKTLVSYSPTLEHWQVLEVVADDTEEPSEDD